MPPFCDASRRRLFLFSSLSAIFDVFTSTQIGCGLQHLYDLRLADGGVYQSSSCVIRREVVVAKRRR